MALKFIMIRHEGRTTTRQIRRKPARPAGLEQWLEKAKATASDWRAPCYAFRFGGRWHLMDTVSLTPVKSYAVEHKAAAEMWLITRAAR